MNKLKSLAFVALAAFGLSAHAREENTIRWDVDFESPTSNGVSFVQGELGNLTNSVAYSGTAGVQPYASGVWYALDGDESYVTNGIVTNVVAGVNVETNSTYLKLDTQGNDLRWAPTNTMVGIINLVDADLYLVGSDSAPDAGDFDGNADVQTAIFLKNEIDDGTGDTTNSVLCVYVYNSGTEANGWQELEGVEISDNSWHHVRVSIDYKTDSPMVSVSVDNQPMHTRGAADTEANRKWTVANTATAKRANQVQSVSFRGTGAVDNFVGTSQKKVFDTLTFAAEVYINNHLQPVAGLGEDGNLTRYKPAEAGDIGSGLTVEFGGFIYDDFDPVEQKSSYGLNQIVLISVDGTTEDVYNYHYDVEDGELTPLSGESASIDLSQIDIDGTFSIEVSTDGAVEPTNLVAKIYFVENGASNALDVVDMAGVVTTNAQLVLPSSFENGGTTNFTWTFDAVSGGNLLSTIRVANGASLVSFENGVATVSVTLDEALSDHTLFVTATYAAGTLAEGQELRYTEAGGVYTFAPYTPPVAIRVSADGTTTNECSSLRQAIEEYAQEGDTVYLVADDRVSFSATATEIGITQAITIDGNGYTLYGLSDYTPPSDGSADHDVYVAGSGNVTITNLVLAGFGDAAYVNQRCYPVWVGRTYAGVLTLDGVTISNFVRTAVNVGGGTVNIRNCEFVGDTNRVDGRGHAFQGGVEVNNKSEEEYFATVTIENSTVTGMGSNGYGPDSDSGMAAAIQMTGKGSITIASGSFDGQYSLILDSPTNTAPASGDIVVTGGTFVSADPTDAFVVGERSTGTLTISGGWFDREPEAEFLAKGYGAVEAAPGTDTPWTVVLADAIWIGGASGDWNVPANWDVGCVPTNTTVVTFTNDAQVAISGYDRCKEMVLTNAVVTLGGASGVAQPILRFYGDEKRAVSVASGATGSLGVNGIALFNEVKDEDDLKIDCALEILGDVTFRGVSIVNKSKSASFTITGKTTVSATARLSTIDFGTTKFQGGIEVAKGVTAKITTNPDGGATIGTGVTLVANDGAGNPTAIWLMQVSRNAVLLDGISVSVDAAHAETFYVKKGSESDTGSYGGACIVYEAVPKPTVFVIATDENVTGVTGVTNGMYVTPGVDLTIGVTVAEGYEPSVTIKKASDNSVLLTTNAASFVYAMPEYGINVTPTAVLKTFDITFKPENGGVDIVTNVAYGATAYIPADPTLAGFTFLGWTNALDATDATAYTNNPMPAVTSNATYAAKWEETPSGHIGAKSDEGFVILAPADGDYDTTKPLTFAAPNITAGTVAISASMVGPDSGTTAQLTLLYKTDLTAANYSTVEVIVKDIDATAGTATVELPANFMDGKNTLFFFGFSNEPGVLDDPQP